MQLGRELRDEPFISLSDEVILSSRFRSSDLVAGLIVMMDFIKLRRISKA
jgi:hypothetical protein